MLGLMAREAVLLSGLESRETVEIFQRHIVIQDNGIIFQGVQISLGDIPKAVLLGDIRVNQRIVAQLHPTDDDIRIYLMHAVAVLTVNVVTHHHLRLEAAEHSNDIAHQILIGYTEIPEDPVSFRQRIHAEIPFAEKHRIILHAGGPETVEDLVEADIGIVAVIG